MYIRKDYKEKSLIRAQRTDLFSISGKRSVCRTPDDGKTRNCRAGYGLLLLEITT